MGMVTKATSMAFTFNLLQRKLKKAWRSPSLEKYNRKTSANVTDAFTHALLMLEDQPAYANDLNLIVLDIDIAHVDKRPCRGDAVHFSLA
jgi:hypothetical protein